MKTKKSSLIILLVFALFSCEDVPLPTPGALGDKYIPTKVEFPANDGLIINGNLYEVDKNKPIILLTHQSG